MVQIVIKLSEDPVEWGMIELQGFLESQHQELANIRIGDLHFNEKGIPYLIIGHHLLTGKVSSLDKPYAVLRKQPDRSYVVAALIKQKLIFKNRPKPIIVKPQAIKI